VAEFRGNFSDIVKLLKVDQFEAKIKAKSQGQKNYSLRRCHIDSIQGHFLFFDGFPNLLSHQKATTHVQINIEIFAF